MIAHILIISLYLLPIQCIPKSSQETGNDIEEFLVKSQGNVSSSASQKKPDKFMEDLIEVQRTYRNLKQKWQRIMEEKGEVIRRASDSSTSTTTTTTATSSSSSSSSSEVQEIDVDVFEAPDKFQDISEPSAFDNLAFEDISSSGAQPQKLSELDEIQLAIREAFGKGPIPKEALINVGGAVITTVSPVRLEEIIGMSTTSRALEAQRDGAPTHLKLDQSTPAPTTRAPKAPAPESSSPEPTTSSPAPTTSSSTTMAPVATRAPESFGGGHGAPNLDSDLLEPSEPLPTTPKSLIGTFGSPPGLQTPQSLKTRSPIRPQIATEWRRKLIQEAAEDQDQEDPFESRPTEGTPTVVPMTSTTTSTTPLPLHILPKSTFHSSGSNPDALPAFNLFRYPDHVQIPFFGAKSGEASGEEGLQNLQNPRVQRPTTPEPSGEEPEEPEEEEVEVPMSEVEDKESESEYDAGDSESEGFEEITASDNPLITTTGIPIDKNEDYVEETFSKEVSDTDKIQNFDDAIQKSSQIPESFGIGKAPDAFTEDVEDVVSSSESQSLGSFAIGKAPEPPTPLEAVEGLLEASGPAGPPGSSFGIGRSPPGALEPSRPATFGSKNAPKEFPTLISQEVENFFGEGDSESSKDSESESSSSLGSFGSAELQKVMNIPVEQHLEILEDPTTTERPKPKEKAQKPKPKSPKPIGIFETGKLSLINQKAYHPPMFPSPMSSQSIQMPTPGNPYFQRTTIPPIGPHGLAEKPTDNVINSVDMELPALGMGDNGIMNRARREYQKEFEQQIRDVRMIDEEISKISKINDDGRAKNGQRCSQIYAHTLSLPQIQQMSASLGLGDVAVVIKKASDLTTNHRIDDISKLEIDLEEKRRLIAKVEILLSLAESRALLFDLLKEQKKIVEKMENRALDLLEKTNFRPPPPSPFSAADDISELSSAVQQVLGSPKSKKGWSMMKKKVVKASKKSDKKSFELIPETESEAPSKKTGHLQETAEIVEPILLQNDQFGRQPVPAPVVVHRRPLPLAPPTMSPMAFSFARPAQRAAHHLTATQPITPPRFTPPTDDEVTESDTVHELIDMLHEDIIKLPEDEQQQVCRQVQCDFEKADLCNFESSHDETTRLAAARKQKLRRRDKREADLLEEQSTIADDLLPYTFRAWSIWAGRKAQRQKQIDIGPDFSPRNTHFAAVFLEPQQAGILSVPLILSGTSTRIRLRLFEGSRGIRLRVCCDRYCPMETEPGVYRGHRMWLRKTVTCPANTQTLSFECLNDGSDRGACGVDEVFVDASRCHQYFNEGDQL